MIPRGAPARSAVNYGIVRGWDRSAPPIEQPHDRIHPALKKGPPLLGRGYARPTQDPPGARGGCGHALSDISSGVARARRVVGYLVFR